MRTTHTGLNISANDFTALIEDLVKSLNSNNVPPATQQMLLGALAPLQADIVQIPGPRQVLVVQLGGVAPAPAQVPGRLPNTGAALAPDATPLVAAGAAIAAIGIGLRRRARRRATQEPE